MTITIIERFYNTMEKICRECGIEIVEHTESALYECERCIGRHEH